MVNIIAIVGKTNSGKDTAAKYIHDKYDIPFVVSATTRPKRDYETNGKEHWFITPDKMRELTNRKDVIAYTKNEKTGIEYAATLKDVPANGNCIYIINPEGIRWYEEHGTVANLKSIYVDCDENKIVSRGLARGDNPDVLSNRLSSEREEFDAFRDSGKYDYLIDNSADSKEHLFEQIDEVIDHVVDEDITF